MWEYTYILPNEMKLEVFCGTSNLVEADPASTLFILSFSISSYMMFKTSLVLLECEVILWLEVMPQDSKIEKSEKPGVQ